MSDLLQQYARERAEEHAKYWGEFDVFDYKRGFEDCAELMKGFMQWRDDNYCSSIRYDNKFYRNKDRGKTPKNITYYTTSELLDIYITNKLKE